MCPSTYLIVCSDIDVSLGESHCNQVDHLPEEGPLVVHVVQLQGEGLVILRDRREGGRERGRQGCTLANATVLE